MVFESVVTELINKFLGEYIENLDSSQLNVSLWGGDVVLTDLLIKRSALDVLNLPVKLEYGRLGKLVLKIPFKDMWNGQIDAIIEELFLLVVPTSQVKYDAEKEAKDALDAKRTELARIAKNKEMEVKAKEKIDDSMMEKLIARMIKNIHVEINKIHVRYEDHTTFKDRPFSVGFTLNTFALESCTNLWTTTGNLKDMHAILQIFKLCTMDGLAFYLNPSVVQFSNEPSTKYIKIFSESIATADYIPAGYQYLLGPINVKAKLKLNPKPEIDGSNYTIPKVWLDMEMQKLRIGLTKNQYQVLMQLGEGLDQARKAAPYRKYRPDVPSYRGHYKEWWHFAYTCILEEKIRRARQNWDWNHMKAHKQTCKTYAETYRQKLMSKKPSEEIEHMLTECEHKLDLVNLVIIRHQIEAEVEKIAEKEKNLKANRGWFGYFWGSSKEEEVQDLNSAAAIMRKFEEAMTPQEKEKLFRAIDYQENSAPAHYPETYEEMDLRFYLHGLQVVFLDTDKEYPDILNLEFSGVQAGFKSRPSGNAISVTTSVKNVNLFGVKQGDKIPSLLNSEPSGSESVLFSVSYEKNPLNRSCGECVKIQARSILIIYDAQTIIELVNMFKVQNPSTLNQLQAAAAGRLEGLKEMSALGLEYAIQQHSILDIQVDLEASQLIIPHGGFYIGLESLFVVNFGSLKVRSLEKLESTEETLKQFKVKQLKNMGKSEEEIMAYFRESSYDKFILRIENFQVLIAKVNEDWRNAMTSEINPMKIVQPTLLEIQFHKCLIMDDPALPQMRLLGELPSVAINISESRLLEALKIAQSIPFPHDEEPSEIHKSSLSKSTSQLSVFKDFHGQKKPKKKEEEPIKQTTDLEAKFVMTEFKLSVANNEANETSTPFVIFEVRKLEAEMWNRTYNQEITLKLGGVQVKQNHHNNELFIINTTMKPEVYLITIKYVNVNKRSPDFVSTHSSIVKLLTLDFTTLDVCLHQEALINVLKLLSSIQDKVSSVGHEKDEKQDRKSVRTAQLTSIPEETSAFFKEQLQKKPKSSNQKNKKRQAEIIDLKVSATFGNIGLKVMSDVREISAFLIGGITASYTMQDSFSQANVHLSSINITDLNSLTDYKNIVSVEGSESLKIEAIMYDLDDNETDKNNMSIKINMGCHRVVFLNAFVTGMMNFLNNFQTAQQAIKEASAAAAEAAKTNIKDVHEKATRIELSVKIKAPVIYVPMNSTSKDCLMLDMGNLTVCNSIDKLNVVTESDDFPLVDEMKVELQNLKLSRVILDKDTFTAEHEILLLQPVTFTLLLKRNLSVSWYSEIPDIEMFGRLKKINLLLSNEDYAKTLSVLNGNLSEEFESLKPVPSVVRERKSIAGESTQFDFHKTEVEITKECKLEQAVEQKHAKTAIKFEFIMDSLVIELFSGSFKAKQQKSSPLHLPENGLAKFCLTYFAVKGQIYSDGLLATTILLMNCTLDDMRPTRKGSLIRIMERTSELPQIIELEKETDSKSVRSMLDVTVKKDQHDMFVDVRVFSFSILVSLDYLMKIKDFFSPDQSLDQPIPSQKLHSEHVLKKKPNQVQSTTQTGMTINVHVEKPDIILVENMDEVNSNCIIMNTEIKLKVRFMGEKQVITGSIKDVTLLAGIYNPEERADSIYQVLRPCTVSVIGSTPEGKGLHVDVSCTDIHLSVSPGVIEILSKVIKMATKTDTGTDEETVTETNYSGLWVITPYEEKDYWFLKTEYAEEAFEDFFYAEEEEEVVQKPELAIVSAPTILLTLEAGVGNKTLPMLLLHLGFQSNVNNWSTKTMYLEASMSVVMAYYNSRLALWEPLIEPIEEIKNGRRTSTPWELKTKVSFYDISSDSRGASAVSPVSEIEPEELPQTSKMAIDITSTENLEISVTKTCLDVLKQLGNAFSNAIEQDSKTSKKDIAPYVLRNETGLSMSLDLERSHFKVTDKGNDYTGQRSYSEVILETGASVQLAPKTGTTDIRLLDQLNTDSMVKDRIGNKFVVAFDGIDTKLEIPVLRADKKFFSLKYRKGGSDEWGVLSDVIVENGSTIVTLRSVLQVFNHFSEPVSVYYMTKNGNEVECVGTVLPDEKLNLPLDAVYTPTNIYWLFFNVNGYMVSIEPFVWKDLQKTVTMTKTLKCEPRSKQDALEPYYIKAVGEIEQVYFENTNRFTMASTIYNVHLYPSVYLKNCLPIDIIICLPGAVQDKRLEASQSMQIPTIDAGHSAIVIKLPQYLEKDWSCRSEIVANPPEFSVWSFESFDSVQKVVMDLGMRTEFKHDSLIMSLYCPFWMLNKTGLMLSYRKSSKAGKEHSSPVKSFEDYLNVLYHPENYKGPILFSFRSKAFFGKKKAMIRVEDGEWSDKFSIDVAGSKGVVSCKYNDQIYQIGVHNQLTYNSLTKQITFTPYFVLINNADFIIECQEADRPADPVIKVQPGECSALWPKTNKEKKSLRANVSGFPDKTAAFIYTDVHTTLLKLNNKFGGLNVDIQINEGGIYISLSRYSPGNAPALIINHTPYPINMWEKGSINVKCLQAYNRMFYAWENPCGPRRILWEDDNKREIEDDLRKDNLGAFKIPEIGDEIFYVTFLNGTQRVLLFTRNRKIAGDCQLVGNVVIMDQEVTMSIHGVGLSLINNDTKAELLYLCIASSGIIWETQKSGSHRWRPLNESEVLTIEDGYQRYLREVQVGHETSNRVLLEPKLEVDFVNMQMLRPHLRHLRRTFQTGLWLQYRTTEHQVQLHAKINRLQIDNQLSECVFPVILAPVAPPKSIAQSSVMKPFAELSIVKRLLEHSTVQQFKYFKVLIQEFHVKVDIGFMNALMALFEAEEVNEAQESELFRIDMQLVDKPLLHHVALITSAEQKNFFDLLHFSPLKIHISFSMSGSGGGPSAMPQVLNVLLQGIGVTLTDINDIVFKLAYFEREYTFMTNAQLISEATSHYTGQAIKQLYVLVLGLDVIGNPYGLVIGTMKGIEDLFYEPFQGAIQGPGEFAEGLYYGVRSMLGHTVGGITGAASKITGALGKGIATLTFDKDYQRKRQEQLNKQPANLQEGLARSGKGLVMGVFDGVTGVVMKPISGAKEDGVEGFFKGVGKGMVGLVTRPTAGVIDFASGSLGAVRRCAELSEEVKRVRPPRFFKPDGLVRSYIREEAEGHKILQELEKGKYANTDIYFFHLYINKDVLLLTDKRIAYVEHSDLFGGWKVNWSHNWQELSGPPVIVEKGVMFSIKDSYRKKKLGIFGSSDHAKLLLIPNQETKQLVANKMQEQLMHCE